MLDELIKYANSQNASQDITEWLTNVGVKKTQDQGELEHIIDYLVTDNAPKRLRKMSFKQAKTATDKWLKASIKKGKNLIDGSEDIESVYELSNGYKIVKLKTKKALQREGFLMGHCVGSYDTSHNIYSFRDTNNLPHATMEVAKKEDEITQIKGKGNGAIHPKYINSILEFFDYIKFDIRPYDMKNLGYYHVQEDVMPMLEQYEGFENSIVVIREEQYLV